MCGESFNMRPFFWLEIKKNSSPFGLAVFRKKGYNKKGSAHAERHGTENILVKNKKTLDESIIAWYLNNYK